LAIDIFGALLDKPVVAPAGEQRLTTPLFFISNRYFMKKMKANSRQRLGFVHSEIMDLIFLFGVTTIIFGLTIALTFSLVEIAHSFGYSWRSAFLLFPISLIVVVAYLFGIPYLVGKWFYSKKEKIAGEWFGLIVAFIWLSATPIVIVLGHYLHTFFTQK
jgi:hypothetical protein